MVLVTLFVCFCRNKIQRLMVVQSDFGVPGRRPFPFSRWPFCWRRHDITSHRSLPYLGKRTGGTRQSVLWCQHTKTKSTIYGIADVTHRKPSPNIDCAHPDIIPNWHGARGHFLRPLLFFGESPNFWTEFEYHFSSFWTLSMVSYQSEFWKKNLDSTKMTLIFFFCPNRHYKGAPACDSAPFIPSFIPSFIPIMPDIHSKTWTWGWWEEKRLGSQRINSCWLYYSYGVL